MAYDRDPAHYEPGDFFIDDRRAILAIEAEARASQAEYDFVSGPGIPPHQCAPLDVEQLARALHNVSYGCQYPGRPSRADAIYHKGHAAQIAAEYAALEEPTP